MTSIDIAIILIFTLLVFICGLSFSKSGKNIKSFFAAGGALPWWMSGLSLFMSFFSAGTFVIWGSIAYSSGWIAVTIQWTMCIAGLIIGFVIAPKWQKTKALTAAEFITDRLGYNTKKIYAYLFLGISMFTTGAFLYPVAKTANYSPEIILETQIFNLEKGEQYIDIEFFKGVPNEQFAFVTFLSNKIVSLKTSNKRHTGVLSVFNGVNKAVSNNGKQSPPANIGVDNFEFWTPHRRPEAKNIAMEISPAIDAFYSEHIGNGYVRPYKTTNAWVAALGDENATIKVQWDEEKELSEIKLYLDPDYDHPLESTLMGHPEEVTPFCVRDYKIMDLNGTILFETQNNYQTINTHTFESKFKTKGFSVELRKPSAHVPAGIFELLCV